MKKSWKILHRSVYAIMIFTLLHVAFLKMWKNWVMAIVETFIPFVLYTAWKIAEWKWVKINIKESLNNFLNS